LGQGTGTNPSTGNSADIAAAYPTYYGNGRQQYLVLASELNTLGFTSGNISSIGFRVAGTSGDPATMNGYTVKIRSTNATALTSTFQSPATVVYGPINYTPTLNAINTHSFTTPYFWDGISNLVIDICFSNQARGNIAYQTYLTSTAFVSTAYYEADGTGGASACTRTTGSGTGSKRPNMIFTIGANSFSAVSNGITMNVNTSLIPSVSIAVTSGTNPLCAGDTATFTATPVNGGSAPVFVWKNGNTIVGSNSPSFTPSSVLDGDAITCLMTSSESCATITGQVSSNTITMGVYPPINFSAIAQSGDTLFATQGFSSYKWYDNTTVIPGAVNYYYVASHSGNYSVEVTDNNGCTATVQKANVIANVNDMHSIIQDFTVHYAMGNLYLEMNTTSTASFNFQLTDAVGKEIFQKKIFLKNGKNDFEINGINLSEGIYFVKILNSIQTMARKIFIK
jgi:hypothetical protein